MTLRYYVQTKNENPWSSRFEAVCIICYRLP